MYQVTPHRYVKQTYGFSKKDNFLVAGFICALFVSGNAYAQGVVAGTNVPNIAVVSYSIDDVQQEVIESSPSGNSIGGIGNGLATAFVVDRKVDLLVTGNTNANVNPGDTQAEVTFTLENQGNDIQKFSLLPENLLTTDNFDVNNCTTNVDSVSGTALAGVVLPTSGNIKLSPDQQANISVRCDVPLDNSGAPIMTGHTALVGLIATAEKNDDGTAVTNDTTNDPSTIETVFTDGAGTDDNTTDASHSARRTYITTSSSAAPELTMNKTILSVVDNNNGNTAISGSEVTYKINIQSTGIGTIENFVVSDPTPEGMTYKSGSITIDSVSQTDVSDTDNTDYGISSPNTATIDLGNFVAGSQYDIQLTYIIN